MKGIPKHTLLVGGLGYAKQGSVGKVLDVTLPKTNIAMENPRFWWYLQGNMGIFMGYVSFREGTSFDTSFGTLYQPPKCCILVAAWNFQGRWWIGIQENGGNQKQGAIANR